MGDLSFLPQEELARRPSLFAWRRLAIAALLAALVGLVTWFYAREIASIYDMRAELSALNATYDQIKSVQDLQKQVQESEQRLQAHERLINPYRTTVRIRNALEVLNGSVPEGMLLDSFRVDGSRQVEIAGHSPSLTDVAKFIVALEKSGMYTSAQASFPGSFQAGGSLPAPEPPPDGAGTGPGPAPDLSSIRFELRGVLSKRGSG